MQSAQELVPGSAPTMAQASLDPGLAQLERTFANNQEVGKNLIARYIDQRAARMQAVRNVAGSDEHYNAIKAGRDLFAKEDYARAMSEGIDTEMAKALKPQIDSLLRRPSIQQAKQVAKSLAQENDIKLDNFGSIEGLDWLKKGLDNIISKARQPGNSVGDAKLRALEQTKQDLMATLEQIAPAYKTANDNFAAMSKQVNAMDVGRLLQDKMQGPLAQFGASGRELKNAYASSLADSIDSVKRATGRVDLPLNRVMPPQEIASLENVARDMARSTNAENLGRAVGSNTAQNLASQNLLRRVLGPAGLPETWSESTMLQTMLAPVTGLYKLGGAERKITDLLSEIAMNPKRAAELIQKAPPSQRGLLMQEVEKLLPGQAAGLLSYRQ